MLKNLQPTILLLGGGYTLQRVAELLPKHSVVLTSRSQEKVEGFTCKGYAGAQVDFVDPATISALFENFPSIRTVVDGVPPVAGSDPAAGVREIVKAVRASSVLSRLIYLSTTGVYGERGGSWVDEETPCHPWHRQGLGRLACEEAYRALPIRTITIRVPAIYGPGRGIEKSLKQGTYRIIDNGERWTNRIHVDDLAGSIVAVTQADEVAVPDILCVSDDEPAQQRQIVEDFCRELQIELPPSISFQEAERREQFTMLSNQRVCNEKLRRFLGVPLRFPTYREWLTQLKGAEG